MIACTSTHIGITGFGLGPLAAIFTALLIAEKRSTFVTEAWYWSVVIVLRAAATNLADLATHTFGWPYLRVILGLTVTQMLVVWPVLPRQVSPERTSDESARDHWLVLALSAHCGHSRNR